MAEINKFKRFIYSATVISGSGSQSFYIDEETREEADNRAANKESDGMYANDSEVIDLDSFDYEDETTIDDYGDFPLISREQALLAKLEAAEKGNEFLKEQLAQLANFNPDWDKLEACQESWRELAELQKETLQRAEAAEARLLVPVKLPSHLDYQGATRLYRDAVEKHLRASGYPVEGGE